jgi:hypothetical protein
MRARKSRQIWLIALVIVLDAGLCAEAIAIPGMRWVLLCCVVVPIGAGFWAARRDRQRRERAALTAQLAAPSRDDIPADVMELLAADERIRAIKRYRELTGVGLREAKAVIDSL